MKTKKTVLMMGRAGTGKTSTRTVVFASYKPKYTKKIAPTFNVEFSHFRFLRRCELALRDCGGNDDYMDNYVHAQREQIFSNVNIFIHFFDVRSFLFREDIQYYMTCIEALAEFSPEAEIYCFIHRMDTVFIHETKDDAFRAYEELLIESTQEQQLNCTCFPTSIMDESLYRPWSKILYNMIPNVDEFENYLIQIGEITEADELLLLDYNTFLVLVHYERIPRNDDCRFEKITKIIKQFKITCSKHALRLHSIEVRNSLFSAYIQKFTENTYIMICSSDPHVTVEAAAINIGNTRKYFDRLEKATMKSKYPH